jgi:hypothetical protein
MGRPPDRNGQIFPPDLVANAMRDSGYKNTAFALAELIDNSIEAKAKIVEVIGVEETQLVNERQRRRLSALAVLDNGDGMDAEVLRASLSFGCGTHLDERSGIGRFGMGLPNASFSQAKRVEIWSWQNGPTNALYTYIDLEEISSGKQNVVPKPIHKALPKVWHRRAGHALGETGTLIHWPVLDEERLTWKQAKATFGHTDTLIGRIYRRFIANNRVKIRLVAYEGDVPVFDDFVKVNDPMYLMAPSSTPAPFDTKPMFQQWGEDEIFEVTKGKKKHKIVVRFSYATLETVPTDGRDRGTTTYGKHAAKNVGVSLMRAGRELDLDANWAIGYDPRERWWGCEVDFPPALDEIFGVTINKQAATLWAQFAQLDWTALAEDQDTTTVSVIERLKAEGDPRGILLDVAEFVRKQLSKIRDTIRDQTKGGRQRQKRHEDPTDEDYASEKFKERSKDHPTPQDKEVFGPTEAKTLETDLKDAKKYSPEIAKQIVAAVWERKLRVIYLVTDLDGAAFFKVEEKPGGVSEVIINRKHPFYDNLYETLLSEEHEHKSLEERLHVASTTLKLMFAAWARFEQESTQKERQKLDDVRQDWGRMARFFLQDSED